MSFELYEPATRGQKEALITLRKDRTISFNTMAQKHLNGFNMMLLYYDRSRALIGFKPVNDDPSAQKITRRDRVRGSEAFVSCKGFFDFYGLSPDGRKHSARYENGMLVVQLEKANADPLRVYHGEKAS